MELQLEIIEAQTTRKGESSITFNRKSGTISLSTTFCREVKVDDRARMAIAKDPKREKDWYLVIFSKDNDPKGIQSRRKDETGSIFNCSTMAHAFMDVFCLREEKSIKVPLGLVWNPILDGRAKAYPILTKALEK